MLVSFDVKSLFTQISQDFAINCLEKALNNSDVWKTRTLLEKEDILELGKLCLSSTVFTYQDKLYKQVQGTPMGSSVSVPLAEIVMQEIENQICSNSPNPIKFWRRYMDDVIAIIPKKKNLRIS